MNDLCVVFEVLHGPEKRVNHLAEIIAELREPVCETPIPVSVEKPQRSEHEQTKHKLKVGIFLNLNMNRLLSYKSHFCLLFLLNDEHQINFVFVEGLWF